MLEKEGAGYLPDVEVVFTPDQDTPFAAKRSNEGWQLAVNRNHFLARGFTPDEIDGAIALEEVRLGKQTRADTIAEVEGLNKWQVCLLLGMPKLGHLRPFLNAYQPFLP